jgi:medium-chain acyl-[acyl-carrier-protein] hydrolase
VNVADQAIALSSDWLRFPEVRTPGAATRLFCFAHACGSAIAFRPWMAAAPPGLEVVAVELPGHGDRIAERPVSDIGDLAAAIRSAMGPYLDRPYALYGHSMGAAVAIVLARLLAADPHGLSPFTLVIGGCAPACDYARSSWYLSPECSDEELIAWMRRVGGTPPDVLAVPRLLPLILRLMRADLAVLDSWRRNHPPAPLPCPIRAIAGRHDAVVPAAKMSAWQAETAADFSLTVVDGNHFFYSQATRTVLKLIAADQAAEAAELSFR